MHIQSADITRRTMMYLYKSQHTKTMKKYALLLLYAALVLCLMSCSKAETDEMQDNEQKPTSIKDAKEATLNLTEEIIETKVETNETATLTGDDFLSEITKATDSFSTRMETQDKIRSILSSDIILDATTISNMLAGLDTEEIARILVNTSYEREKPTIESYNYMNIYEEILRRGKPAWSRLMALSELSSFYRYNKNRNVINEEKQQLFEKMGLELKPSDTSDNASKRSFVTIKMHLLQTIPYEQQLPLADEIERMAEEGMLFSRESLGFVSIQRAIALINVKRAAEARAIIQKLHDNIDNMAGNKREIDDVDNFMDRQMNRDLYPEFSIIHPDYEKRHSIYY